jgi:hypothetical protein
MEFVIQSSIKKRDAQDVSYKDICFHCTGLIKYFNDLYCHV